MPNQFVVGDKVKVTNAEVSDLQCTVGKQGVVRRITRLPSNQRQAYDWAIIIKVALLPSGQEFNYVMSELENLVS